MLSVRYVLIDVFTDRPLAGNQLAVFTDARKIPEALLQPLAREMNLAETVFVYPPAAGGDVKIRIFTVKSELPFAGHPTLGAAFVLGDGLQRNVLKIETGMGIVPITFTREGDRISFARMQQPIPRVEPYPEAPALLAALGVERSELPVERYDLGIRHVYVALPSPEAVAALAPDWAALLRLGGFVGVNCFAGAGRRWKTRMFAPSEGVAEDPATGSAAGPLACHLARHGRIAFGEEIVIEQGAEVDRPSLLHAAAFGSAERIERVEVGGRAVMVARADLRI